MNNWRLLLLAVVVVVQPIGSFTESNLIDGRECCERTEDVRFYGTERRFLDGNREDRHTSDKRRLNLFDESRGWRYERSILSRLERTERRLSFESSRYPTDQASTRATSRKIREDQYRNRDESRGTLGQVERDSRESRSRDALDATRSVRLSRNTRDTSPIQKSRDSVSRPPIRNSRDFEERQVAGRDTAANKEREVVARSVSRRDTRLSDIRFDSRIQLEDNRDRRAFVRNIQADRENQRFTTDRDTEIRARMSNERNDRDVRAVRAELRRQRDIQFRAKMINDNREAGRIRYTRDESERLIQNRMDTRITDRLERLGRDENRSFMDTLRNTDQRGLSTQLSRETMSTKNAERLERQLESQDRPRETRNARLTRNSDRITQDARGSINHLDSSRRVIRDSSEERRLQRDRILSSRNRQSREIDSFGLRRRVLERGIDRAIRMSVSADQRQDIREFRASRSDEDVRDGTKTTYNRDERQQTRNQERTIEQRMTRGALSTQRPVTRLPRTENIRLERATSNRNDIRRTDEREMTKRVVVLATRNMESDQRIASRESRTENIRLERLVNSRAKVTENERREKQSEDTRFDRLSSERVQAERRQEIRNEMSRTREVRMGERLDSRRERDISSLGSVRVHAERRQDNREVTGHDRVIITRDVNGVRFERIISEPSARLSRDVRGESRKKVIEAERRDDTRIAKHSRDSRDESNLAARRILTRTQETRDARVVRDETRVQRGTVKMNMISLQRNSRVAERLNERESRPETQNERMTRNIERQRQHDSGNRLESRIDMRSNVVRMETSRIPLRDENVFKKQGGFRNVYVTSDLENPEPVGHWKLALYTLQGIYLCGLLVHMLTENGSKIKKRSFNWWSSHKDLVKVD